MLILSVSLLSLSLNKMPFEWGGGNHLYISFFIICFLYS